jgi:hypothetical protein
VPTQEECDRIRTVYGPVKKMTSEEYDAIKQTLGKHHVRWIQEVENDPQSLRVCIY